jgi:predicted flavoprotein YhiN
VATILADLLPKKLAYHLAAEIGVTGRIGDQSDAALKTLAGALTRWEVTPTASEGYRTAEVTLGGIATDGISSKTMESKLIPGLFLIGEAVDVTGWLGGYNFQWAWASGAAAGRAIAAR